METPPIIIKLKPMDYQRIRSEFEAYATHGDKVDQAKAKKAALEHVIDKMDYAAKNAKTEAEAARYAEAKEKRIEWHKQYSGTVY